DRARRGRAVAPQSVCGGWRDEEVRAFALDVLRRGNFDVCDLAENFLGIDLYVGDLRALDEQAGAPVFGLAQPESRTIEICQRAESYEPLFRSTVMHRWPTCSSIGVPRH